MLGVEEHHWLDLPGRRLRRVDADRPRPRFRAILDEVRPDTVVTFGPDGFTGHPDHQAVSRWVDLALARAAPTPRLLHPVRRQHPVDPGLDNDYGVFELGLPRTCRDDEIDVLLPLDGVLLDRKVAGPAAPGVADSRAGRGRRAAAVPRLGGDRGARRTADTT